MKTQTMLLAALASIPASLAHTTFTDYYVDGMPQGDGVAIRMNANPDKSGSPIASLDSDDMACNVGGTKGVSRVQSVPDGALLSFEIRGYANDPSKAPLDRGHKGPCAFYLKKVSSAVNDQGKGDGWFKIFDHGYDASTQRWCTDEIIDNKGLLSVNLPKGLEGGYYLARPEILALHAASAGDPQFYTGCGQIFVESSGNLGPEETVSIPGYVKYGQPATSFNIYDTDAAKYTLPGPAIAKLVAKSDASASSQTNQTEGLKPEGCLVENGNWCGKEVSSYSTETACWAASQDCWDQGQTCFVTSLPTGNAGCLLWQTKCKQIQNACTAKNFNGPPDKGKVLTPEKKSIDVGLIMPTSDGGVVASPSSTTSASASKNEDSKTATPATPTPYAAKKEEKASESTQALAQTSSISASYSSTSDDNDKDDNKPAYTITAPPSSAATPAPAECPEGWKCVLVTEVAVVTQTVYVTAAHDSYKRSAESFSQRRRRAHHI